MNEYLNIEILNKEAVSKVSALLNLKSDTVKQKLSSTDREIAAEYMAELFMGNGWMVSIYGDRKKALLLADPVKTGYCIAYCTIGFE